MKRLLSLFLIGVFFGLAPLRAEKGRLVFYVSVSGNDAWSGRLSAPNAQKSDGPFATLERARDAVRAARITGLRAPATVFVRGGVYPMTQRFGSIRLIPELSPPQSFGVGTKMKLSAWLEEAL